jgi:hypothetical protein
MPVCWSIAESDFHLGHDLIHLHASLLVHSRKRPCHRSVHILGPHHSRAAGMRIGQKTRIISGFFPHPVQIDFVYINFSALWFLLLHILAFFSKPPENPKV